MNRRGTHLFIYPQAHPPITTNSTHNQVYADTKFSPYYFHTIFSSLFLTLCLCTKLFFFAQRHLKTFLSKRWKSYILHFSGNCRLITLPVLLFPQLFVLKLMLLFFLSVDPFLFACFWVFQTLHPKHRFWDSSVMETEKVCKSTQCILNSFIFYICVIRFRF